MNTNINLLLHTDEESLRQKNRIKNLNFAAVVSLIIIGSISLILFILIQVSNPASIKKEQIDILKKISQYQSRQIKLFVLNDRVENIDKILSTRKDLSITMIKILAKIPRELLIDNFEINDKSINISGQSASLLAIAEFINNLTDMVRNKEIIKSLTLNSLILDEGKNSYQVSVRSDL